MLLLKHMDLTQQHFWRINARFSFNRRLMLAPLWPSMHLVLTLVWPSLVCFIAQVFVTVMRMMDLSTTRTCLQWSVRKLVHSISVQIRSEGSHTDACCVCRHGVPVDVLAKLQFCYRWTRRRSNHSCHQHLFLSGRLRSRRLRNF